MSTGHSIVTCGNHEPDAIGVHRGMQPEFNVVYAGFDLESTRKELPRLLIGEKLDRASLHTQIGSNQFQPAPVAIAIGGGYDDEAFRKLDEAIAGTFREVGRSVNYAYFRADNELTERLYAEGRGPQKRTPEYTIAIGKRFKARLQEILGAQGLGVGDAGKTFLY